MPAPKYLPLLPGYAYATPSKLLLLLLLCAATQLPAQQFSILFTNSANGTIENCLCPDLPLGGLEKRAQFIHTYRDSNPDVLVVDNGDNFIDYLAPEVQAIVTAAFRITDFDIINLGDQDVAYGTPEYRQLETLVETPGTAVLITKGEVDFSVLPIFHPGTMRFYPPDVFAGLDLGDWRTQLAAWLEADLPPGTFRILLSHAGFDNDQEIAAEYPGIDLIIGGHSQTVVETPLIVAGVPIVQAGGSAGYVGEIRFKSGDSGSELAHYQLHAMTLELPGQAEVLKLIDSLGRSH